MPSDLRADMPTTMRLVTDGRTVSIGPIDHQLHQGAVISLDASDVLLQVAGAERIGDELRVDVDVYDGSATHAPWDRSPSTPGPSRRDVASTDEVTLALHHLGGTGPDLLVCHATGFHGLAYAPLARGLVGTFTVWALDFRGHGASTPPRDEVFTWDGAVDDVLAAIDAIGSSQVLAVGHSLGGAAILRAELARPGSIAAAYVYEPIVFPAEWLVHRGESPMSGPARNRRAAFPSKRAAYERYASRPPLDVLRPDALAAYVEHGFVDDPSGGVKLACLPEHEARMFEADDHVTLDDLVDLDLQLTIGVGLPEGDGGPAALAPGLAATVSGSRLVSYDLGHFGPLEDPDRIATDIVVALGQTSC